MNVFTGARLLLVSLLALGMLHDSRAIAESFNTLAGGVKIRDLKAGEGNPAQVGDIATIHVRGWLDEDGARGRSFFNSRDEGHPVSFVIGDDGVMEGWNVGVVGMRSGGQRMLLIPPGMAYGARAIEDIIPANAALMMHIELIHLQPAEQ